MAEDSKTTLCRNCDQPIEPDDGGAIWYHRDSMEMPCDPPGQQSRDRMADPAKRVVSYTNESFYDREKHAYVVARITEDEGGYEVWAWYATLESAEAMAQSQNETHGVDHDAVLAVVMSSMRQGNRS